MKSKITKLVFIIMAFVALSCSKDKKYIVLVPYKSTEQQRMLEFNVDSENDKIAYSRFLAYSYSFEKNPNKELSYERAILVDEYYEDVSERLSQSVKDSLKTRFDYLMSLSAKK